MQAPTSKSAGLPTYAGRKPQTENANSADSRWMGPGNVVTFVRCLHLLDLDLLEDWPGLHEQLFSTKGAQQNLQQRVKCVEWSLYRLFDIWDPAYTKDVRCELLIYELAYLLIYCFLETSPLLPSTGTSAILESTRCAVSGLDRSQEKWHTW
jgi:HAUS augmin-like complex subunit 6 N-terminus